MNVIHLSLLHTGKKTTIHVALHQNLSRNKLFLEVWVTVGRLSFIQTLFPSLGTGLTHGSCSAIMAFGLGGFPQSLYKALNSLLQLAPTDQFLQ